MRSIKTYFSMMALCLWPISSFGAGCVDLFAGPERDRVTYTEFSLDAGRLLRRCEGGETLYLSKNGLDVAVLRPLSSGDVPERYRTFDHLPDSINQGETFAVPSKALRRALGHWISLVRRFNGRILALYHRKPKGVLEPSTQTDVGERVSLVEFRTRPGPYLGASAVGRSVVVTNYRKPQAKLVPPGEIEIPETYQIHDVFLGFTREVGRGDAVGVHSSDFYRKPGYWVRRVHEEDVRVVILVNGAPRGVLRPLTQAEKEEF